MADDVERLRGMSDEVLQKASNAFDFGETLNVASMRQIVEILADELEVVISQPDCDGDFEGDVWFGHPEKRTLGTHIWRAGAWHELPSELDAVISLLGQARSQRDANAGIIATLRAKVSELETQLRGATIMFSDTAETIATLRADLAKAVEGLEPFAEIADWADRNGHNLHDFDMLIRHITGTQRGYFAGHLGVQAEQFIAAQSLIKELRR